MCVKRERRLSAHPEGMGFDSPLNEFVEFEIPSFDDATRLCLRLALDWFSWVQTYDGLRVVVVMLLPDADDVAALLRSVQDWSRQHNLAAIPFELDGRRYLLEASSPPATGLAA